MNSFNLDDKTRIMLLKMSIVAISGSMLTLWWGASRYIKALEKTRDKYRKYLKLESDVLERFMELAPSEISKKINDEFQFDVIVAELDL